jgi:hypothetical protein
MDRSAKDVCCNNSVCPCGCRCVPMLTLPSQISHTSASVVDPIHLDQDVLPLIDRALYVEGTEDLHTTSAFVASPNSVHTRGQSEVNPAKGASKQHVQGGAMRDGNNKKAGKTERRRRKRQASDAMHMLPKILLARRRTAGQSIHNTLAVETLPISQGAYVGKTVHGGGSGLPQLQTMLNDRFVLIEWDGL